MRVRFSVSLPDQHNYSHFAELHRVFSSFLPLTVLIPPEQRCSHSSPPSTAVSRGSFLQTCFGLPYRFVPMIL